MATILSIPPPQSLLLQRRSSSSLHYHPTLLKQHHTTTLCFSSSSSSSSLQTPNPILAEEDSSPSTTSPSSDGESPENLQFRGCKTCGREEIANGCNGEGRIQGGIATVPGFGWWPIKAFRPCPGFIASGGRYKRRGQSMDEVASGRV